MLVHHIGLQLEFALLRWVSKNVWTYQLGLVHMLMCDRFAGVKKQLYNSR